MGNDVGQEAKPSRPIAHRGRPDVRRLRQFGRRRSKEEL